MKRVCAALILLTLSGSGVYAQSGIYLRLGNIGGEIATGSYEGWIQIQTFETDWSHAEAQMTGNLRRRPDVVVGDIVMSKEIDASTPMLMKFAATAEILPAAALVLVKEGKPFIRYDLRNVLVDAYSISASTDANLEEIALQFDEILITYLPESGSPFSGSFQWNLMQ